jgi:hypothetical protein
MSTHTIAEFTGLLGKWITDQHHWSVHAPARDLAVPFPFGRLILFMVLSVADLILTWRLLLFSHGLVYESNPIARYFLSQYGWPGILGFKCVDVLIVACLTLIISSVQPAAARRVLSMACVVVASVAIYSCFLALRFV